MAIPNIPPNGAGVNPGTSGSVSQSQIVPGMMDVYNQTLATNANNYQNVLNSYGQGSQALNASLPGIYQGYGALNQQIGNTLGQGGTWGVATPAAQAIGQAFAQQQGNSQQQMINAGLGNTTALQNATNQNTLFAGQAYGGLGAQLAQTYAGYQAQTGMAGLSAQMQGLGLQSNLAAEQGRTLAGMQYALPNLVGNSATSLANSNPYRGGMMGGNPNGGGNFLPMGQDTGGSEYPMFTSGGPDTGGYNPFVGTPPNPGGQTQNFGPVSSGGSPFDSTNAQRQGYSQMPQGPAETTGSDWQPAAGDDMSF